MADIQIAVIDEKDTQITLAVPGVQGPVGNAIPAGGTTNQVFYKVSGTNYDAGWTFIGNANVDAAAEIAVSKLADGSARQLIQTDAAGTGVEWASNIDIPGTLDVTGATVLDAAVTIASLDAVATTKAQYEESQIRLNAAFSIGTAGVIPFGVGPAIPPGMAFFGIGPDAYNPIHLLSGSFC